MKLFYDTETTGLPVYAAPVDAAVQPHLVQLGAILMDDDGREVSVADLIVRPDGWVIPDGAARVHGITTEIAARCGVPLATVLSVFFQLRANADELVAYNMDFDDFIMRSAVKRVGRAPSHPGPSRVTCCMRAAGPVVAIPPTERMRAAGFDKFKPPNLAEAYRFFFKEEFHGAHSALADARACARVFFELARRG